MQQGDVKRLEIPLAEKVPFYFGSEILHQFPAQLRGLEFDRCFLVTSQKLFGLFGDRFANMLREHAVPYETIVIEESEANKNWATLSTLCEDLVAAGATKDSILLALGGGVIGNIVGLAAALIYRGIRFVEIPTTVTSQTDGTLSNKQAINGERGKNQFGAYYAPLFVWADCAYSQHEPIRQRRCGVVEGIKNILVSQPRLDAAEQLVAMSADLDRHAELTWRLIESKCAILRKDPTERGFGVVLEYGHTFGHAIDWLSRGALFHGEAISIGMCLAAELSGSLGFLSNDLIADHYRLLGELGTPTVLPRDLEPQAIFDAMQSDNKRGGRGLRFLLLKECGELHNPDGDYQVAVEKEAVLAVLTRFARE